MTTTDCDSCGKIVDHVHPQMTFCGEGGFCHWCVGDPVADPEEDCPDYKGKGDNDAGLYLSSHDQG